MQIESLDTISVLAGLIIGASLVLATAVVFYKRGLAVSTMIYRAMKGEDPLPEPDDPIDSIDEDVQERTH